jgi:uncharacterized protein
MRTDRSVPETRRIALTAQGFNGLSSRVAAGADQLRRFIDRPGLLQIDSVNVLCPRPIFGALLALRLLRIATVDAVVAANPKRFFEYWGHEASILPIDCHPFLRWRMARALRGQHVSNQMNLTRVRSEPKPMPC